MKKKLLITTAVLSLAATLAVGAAVGLGKEALKADAATTNISGTRLYIQDEHPGDGWTDSGKDAVAHIWNITYDSASGFTSVADMQAASVTFGSEIRSFGSTNIDVVMNWAGTAKDDGSSSTGCRDYELIVPWFIKTFDVCFFATENTSDRYLKPYNTMSGTEYSASRGNSYQTYLWGNYNWNAAPDFYTECSFSTVANYKYDETTYAVTTTSNPVGAGTLTGAGTYKKYEKCTVTATANSGYSFSSWSDSGLASHSFNVTADTALTANFSNLPALSTPVLTKGGDNSITWAAVANAQSYEVTVDGGTPYSVSTSATRKVDGIIKPGTHTINVKAIGDHTSYNDSAVASESYTVDAGYFLVGSFQPTAFSEDLVGAVRMSTVSGVENTYEGNVTVAANTQVEAVYSTSSAVSWQNWGSVAVNPEYAASQFPATQGGTYNKSVVLTEAGNYKFRVLFQDNAAHYTVTPLDYVSNYKLLVGETEYNLVAHTGNEFKVENLSLTRGQILGYKDGSTTETSTSKLICNNNLDATKKVMFSKENATVYVDVVAKTIFTELPASVTSAGQGYHVIKNGSSIITMTQNQAPADPTYLEYYTEVTSFAANDVLTFLDLKTSGEVRTVEFKITTINAGGLGDKFETTADGIRAKEAIQAAVYLKLKSGADEVYFGDVSEAVKKATQFASSFLTAINNVCDTEHGTGTSMSALASAWSAQESAFSSLTPDGAKQRLKDATLDDSVAEIRSFLNQYKYVIEKYGSELTTRLEHNPDFLLKGYSQQSLGGYGINRVVNTSNTIAIIVVISVVAITSIGGFMFIKSRKHD